MTFGGAPNLSLRASVGQSRGDAQWRERWSGVLGVFGLVVRPGLATPRVGSNSGVIGEATGWSLGPRSERARLRGESSMLHMKKNNGERCLAGDNRAETWIQNLASGYRRERNSHWPRSR